MKITKAELKQIIREELGRAGGSEATVHFDSAHESLMQAHKDLQMLSMLIKKAGSDPEPTRELVQTIEQGLLSLNDLIKRDVEDLSAADEILNTGMGSYKGTTLPGGETV